MLETKPKISIILPCRNEEEALPFCLKKLKEVIKENNLSAEIIVSDSSNDKSPEIAKKEGVVLVKHDKEGYGNAYLEGFKMAKGEYILMADADATYDLEKIPLFIKELENDNDMVIGDRLSGEIEEGAMPWPNRHIGTPVLSFILRLFFGAKIKDSQSGMRAIKKSSLEKLNLQTVGMEFASEMIVKSIRHNLKIKELPINYYKRKGQSKLKPFSDAYKHMRFMLLYSPLFLFFIPGLILFFTGTLLMAWFYFYSPEIFGIKFFYHPMFLFSLLMTTGYQLIVFSGFAKIYSITHLSEENAGVEKLFKYITIERASIAGLLAIIIGACIFAFVLSKWINSRLGSLDEIKNSIIALTLLAIGAQTIFSSFMLSILGIKEK
jgi:glycosyltransferase involved in cell wall biosynthesis